MKVINLLTILLTIESNSISGQESDGHFQGHATILLRTPYMGGYQYFPICGTTLIGKNWLVTAGHCFTTNILSDIRELMVMITVREKYLVRRRIFKNIDRFAPHPKFSSYPRMVNDMWLVKLKEPTEFDDYSVPLTELTFLLVLYLIFLLVLWLVTGIESTLRIWKVYQKR